MAGYNGQNRYTSQILIKKEVFDPRFRRKRDGDGQLFRRRTAHPGTAPSPTCFWCCSRAPPARPTPHWLLQFVSDALCAPPPPPSIVSLVLSADRPRPPQLVLFVCASGVLCAPSFSRTLNLFCASGSLCAPKSALPVRWICVALFGALCSAPPPSQYTQFVLYFWCFLRLVCLRRLYEKFILKQSSCIHLYVPNVIIGR